MKLGLLYLIHVAILAMHFLFPTALGQSVPAATSASGGQKARGPLPFVREDEYIGSESCRGCHQDEHATWHRSYHRTMTQAAGPKSVLGDFEGVDLKVGELNYRLFKKDDQFFAEMPDPDVLMYVVQGGKKLALEKIPKVTRPVVMTTGSHHYQTYWVESPRYPGLLQTLPLVYLISQKKWIPRDQAFMRGPHDRDHLVTQWNHHCIRCHSTGGNPGLDEKTGRLNTEVGELGISCEACHGPGRNHVKYREEIANFVGPLSRNVNRDSTLVNPADLDHRKSSQVCGQCHGVYVMRDEFAMEYAKAGPLYRPGEDLFHTRYYIQHPTEGSPKSQWEDLKRNPEFFQERWWPDGTVLAGGREFTAMMASGCYQKGTMSCLSCHTMHGRDPVDQLKPSMDGPAACVACHKEEKYNARISEHTFHAPASSGSNCLNCHMPHTTYALLKAIRSHQISSPDVRSSSRLGVPNACNLCHLDKTLEWTDHQMKARYGKATEILTEEQKQVSAFLLWMLKGDAAQRVIAAWHAGWQPARDVAGSDWIAPHLAVLLNDPYGVVRQVAANSLRTLPGMEGFDYDFLSPVNARTNAVTNATARWPGAEVKSRREATLISPDGSVMRDEQRRLLGMRNDRPVTIKE